MYPNMEDFNVDTKSHKEVFFGKIYNENGSLREKNRQQGLNTALYTLLASRAGIILREKP